MYKACNNKICIFPIWNQKSCSQDYTRIELLSRRNCSRLKWKSCSIWNGIPDVLRRAISVDPFSKQFEIVPRARCIYRLCTFMHLSSSYLLPASLWNTFRHTDLYENKGTLGGAFGERKLNFCSAVERFREEEYFLPSYRWPSVTIAKAIERVR